STPRDRTTPNRPIPRCLLLYPPRRPARKLSRAASRPHARLINPSPTRQPSIPDTVQAVPLAAAQAGPASGPPRRFHCEIRLNTRRAGGGAVRSISGLRGDAKRLGNESGLRDCILFGHPSRSALPNHIHCFDSL